MIQKIIFAPDPAETGGVFQKYAPVERYEYGEASFIFTIYKLYIY